MEENDNLRNAQLENLKLRELRNPTFGSLSDDLYAELNERIEILMSENSLMVEQKTLLANELEAHQDELTQRTEEVAELSQVLKTNLKDLQACRQHIAQAEQDRDEASGKALQYSEAMAKAEVLAEDLKEKTVLAQARADGLDRDLREARATVKGLMNKAENEAQTGMRRMKAAEERIMELHSQLLHKTEELDAAQGVVRRLNREYQSARQDAEGMLQVMQGLERQVAAYADREKEVERVASENKSRIEDVLIARDQAVSREKQSALEVERLLAERRAAVQERHLQLERAAEEARQRTAIQVSAVEESLEKMAVQNAELRVECDKASRDCISAREQAEKLQRLFEDERRIVQSTLESLTKELAGALKSVESENARRLRAQNENAEHRLTIDKLRAQMDNLKLNVEQRDKMHDVEIGTLRLSAREAHKTGAEKARALAVKTKEYSDLRSDAEVRQSQLEDKRDAEASVLRQKATESERLCRELETAVAAEEKRGTALVDRLKETCSVTNGALERQLYDASESLKRLEAFSKELEGSLHEVKVEKSQTARQLEEVKSVVLHLQDDLEDAQGTIAALTSQLAASFEARDIASLKSVSALFGPRVGQRHLAGTLRSRAAELAEEIVDNELDDRYDTDLGPLQ
jgi:chromosome segregation ATPase